MAAKMALFAYGSLVDPASASATLSRSVGAPRPARLRGWKRRFSQARDNHDSEKTFARRDDGSDPDWVLGLNLEPSYDPEQSPNGSLIEVSLEELERLDLREIRYERVEVSARVVAATGEPPPAEVFTYVAKPANLALEPRPRSVILARYVRVVEEAFAAIGSDQLAEYRRTTLPYPTEVVEGVLVADRIPEGNPREW